MAAVVGRWAWERAARKAAPPKKGSVTLNVTWPARPVTVAGRLIPVAANVITVTLSRVVNGVVVTTEPPVTASVTRPSTSLTVPGLEIGTYEVTAAAYPDASGTSTAQATGPQAGAMGTASALVTVNAGANSPLPITLFATVASIRFTPATAQFRLGQMATVAATAYDSAGNMVITGPSTISFVSSNPTEVSVTPNANPATLTANATTSGTATITATYSETGVASGQQGTGVSAQLTATVTAAGLSTGIWPKFHGDTGNTGMVPSSTPTVTLNGFTAPYASNVAQQISGGIVYSSPVFNKTGSIMYIGADDGYVYAMNINASGFVGTTPRWSFKTNGPIMGTPVVDVNGNVYVGSEDGNLYALQDTPGAGAAPATAKLLYTFNAGAAITGSPTLDAKGTLYFTTEPTFNTSGTVTTPGKLFFVDSLSGAPKADTNGNPLVFSGDSVGFNTTPALDQAQDLVYVGSEAGVLYAVSTTSGSSRAQYPLSGDTISQSSAVVGLTATGEMVYQATTGGKIYEFRAAAINDGPVAGFTTYSATGSILATPAFNPNNQVLAVATYDNSSGQNDSRVAVVDANTGLEIARTTPILTFLSQRDTTLTQADLSQAQAFLFASSPVISSDGSTVYVGCEDGHVYRVNVAGLKTGATAAPAGSYLTFTSLIETSGNSQVNPILIDSSPGVDGNGHVFIGGLDGSVYAITR